MPQWFRDHETTVSTCRLQDGRLVPQRFHDSETTVSTSRLQDTVVSLSFSPDGKRVVTGSIDNLVKIFIAETGVEVSSFV